MCEFTGTYYRCNKCGLIFDCNDVCLDCSNDDLEDLNAKQVYAWSKACIKKERIRLEEMLDSHDDLPMNSRDSKKPCQNTKKQIEVLVNHIFDNSLSREQSIRYLSLQLSNKIIKEEKLSIVKLINDYFLLPKSIRSFIDNYNSSIDYFNDAVEHCTPNWSNFQQSITVIRNTDLWIEAHIEVFPELIEFRKYVHSKMKEKGITPYPDFYYEPEENHYFCKGRTLEELKEALQNLQNYDNND